MESGRIIYLSFFSVTWEKWISFCCCITPFSDNAETYLKWLQIQFLRKLALFVHYMQKQHILVYLSLRLFIYTQYI